jgi:hypothetical protein
LNAGSGTRFAISEDGSSANAANMATLAAEIPCRIIVPDNNDRTTNSTPSKV